MTPKLIVCRNVDDEGMTNRPSISAYLVFGPGEITVEGVARPIRTAARRGPGATLGVQARIRRVQVGLIFGYGLFETDPICIFLEGQS
jgi:hypothetical protein